MSKRKALSKKTRFDVFKRDGFKCQYCGASPPGVLLHVDHIVPVAEGGENDTDNLITACEHCNQGKGARPLSQIPASLEDRAAEIAEREEQIREFSKVASRQRKRLHADAWKVANIYVEHFSDDGIRKDYLSSIKSFVDKLGVNACLDAMEIAIGRKPYSKNTAFRYFCGVCWNRVREASPDA